MINDICIDCVVYKAHHNLLEPYKCPDCGTMTLKWKQDPSGSFYAECSLCSAQYGIDLNTPCETDRLFHETIKVTIAPQEDPVRNEVILKLSNYFHINALQMRQNLINGYLVETDIFHLQEIMDLLDANGIEYSVYNHLDPREKYRYYNKCNYPYSPMKRLNTNRD